MLQMADQNAKVVIKKEESQLDTDLRMPSDLFDCSFEDNKDNVTDIPGEFYFESDHEALRGNADYHKLLKTYAVLQAKKIQAVQDVESLLTVKQLALKRPKMFLEKFSNELSQLPLKQNVPEMPDIEWDKYKIPSLSHVIESNKPETRFRGVGKSVKTEPEDKERVEGLLDCKVERNSKGQFLVRGRIFDASKPQTFNQPWTPEEQRRLEELLVEYPSEDIEMERWKKIATCLGNRTPIQVQSRVQKYFQKLQKAGLPVPGKSKYETSTMKKLTISDKLQESTRKVHPVARSMAWHETRDQAIVANTPIVSLAIETPPFSPK